MDCDNHVISLTEFPSTLIGPLDDPATWYKITHAGEQAAQWDFQNSAPAFVFEVPLSNLLTSICNFVPCDWGVQRAYSYLHLWKLYE